MELDIKNKIVSIINHVNSRGIQWKTEEKQRIHLQKRKRYGHIPEDFMTDDYDNLIIDIINGNENEIYLYYIYQQDYFVFADRISQWIVIIGENHIIDTAFIIDTTSYDEYLSEREGYIYLGKLKEVLE